MDSCSGFTFFKKTSSHESAYKLAQKQSSSELKFSYADKQFQQKAFHLTNQKEKMNL